MTDPTNLCERLRTVAENQRGARGDYLYKGHADPWLEEAADLIERQTAEIAALKHDVERQMAIANAECTEWQKLRKALEEIVWANGDAKWLQDRARKALNSGELK